MIPLLQRAWIELLVKVSSLVVLKEWTFRVLELRDVLLMRALRRTFVELSRATIVLL
jgi:hypothetical protein